MNQINLNEGINILKKNQKELEAKIEFCEKNEKEYFPIKDKDVKENLFRTIKNKFKNKKELETKIEFCEKNEKEYFPIKDVKENLFRKITDNVLKIKKESKLVEDFDYFKDEINGEDLQKQPLTSNQRTEVTKTPILL